MTNGRIPTFNHDLSLTIPFPDGHITAQLQCPAIAEVNGKTVRQRVMAHRSLALIPWTSSLMPDQCGIVRMKSLNRWRMKVELHRMRVMTKGKVQRPLLLFITIHIHIYYLVPGASQPPEDTNASHPAGDGAVEDSEPTPPLPPIPSQQSSPPPPESLPKCSQQDVDEATDDISSAGPVLTKQQRLEKVCGRNRGKDSRTRGSQRGHGGSALSAPRRSNRVPKSGVSNGCLF